MAERKQVDWESVERDYSAGLLSLREIAAKYGVSPSLITRKKNEGEWPKDLTGKIQAKADSIITGVNTGGVNTSVNSKKASETAFSLRSSVRSSVLRTSESALSCIFLL